MDQCFETVVFEININFKTLQEKFPKSGCNKISVATFLATIENGIYVPPAPGNTCIPFKDNINIRKHTL